MGIARSDRRGFISTTIATCASLSMVHQGRADAGPSDGGLRLGLVTYNLAKDWDIGTIIANCSGTGFGAVELRTTHAHGVEVGLSPERRHEVRKVFEDSPVELASLGSAFEFDSPDAAELRRNIEGAKEYAVLASDVGAKGIKVRPNNLHTDKGISEEATLEQIGVSLHEVATFAADHGVEVRVEVHGRDTARVPRMRRIMDHADCPNCLVCWNSNPSDLLDGGLEENFALLSDRIRFVHMRDLYLEDYPFRRLFGLLRGIGYDGWCCAEIPASTDPLRVMRYYRGLFLALQDRL